MICGLWDALFFESVLWLLYGLKGLDAFHESEIRYRESSFYAVTSSFEHPPKVIVHPKASTWMDAILKFEPECNRPSGGALADLIRVVQDGLLVVELPSPVPDGSRTRINAAQLREKLIGIRQRALQDRDYLFTRRRLNVEPHISSSAGPRALLRRVQPSEVEPSRLLVPTRRPTRNDDPNEGETGF